MDMLEKLEMEACSVQEHIQNRQLFEKLILVWIYSMMILLR